MKVIIEVSGRFEPTTREYLERYRVPRPILPRQRERERERERERHC